MTKAFVITIIGLAAVLTDCLVIPAVIFLVVIGVLIRIRCRT